MNDGIIGLDDDGSDFRQGGDGPPCCELCGEPVDDGAPTFDGHRWHVGCLRAELASQEEGPTEEIAVTCDGCFQTFACMRDAADHVCGERGAAW